MTPERYQAITSRYRDLSIAVLGDFCLDRYLEIDPTRKEVSIETGLPVLNVVNVRAQAGGAGTIVNNLSALGVGGIFPISFVGDDGEGLELFAALGKLSGVRLDYVVRTDQRRTFTYCKPLVLNPNAPPQELSRLDFKNWTPTPALLEGLLLDRLRTAARFVNAIIILDQVDIPDTGVVTRIIREAIDALVKTHRSVLFLADSRRGLKDFPHVVFKMNAAELAALSGTTGKLSPEQVREAAAALARRNGRNVFVTLSERGMLGATPIGEIEHVPSLPLRGEIDIVGAGDAVTANLTCAQVAGASLREALEIANAAASVVIHKLGTTGTASVAETAGFVAEPESR